MMRSTSSPAIFPASWVAVRCASSKYAGTVTSLWLRVAPRYDSASLFSFPRIRAEMSWAVYALPSMSTVHFVPMWRFTERMVRSGLVMACRLATSPTSTSPVLEKPTTDGVVLPPSAFGITTGSPASNTLTTELVVPRSMPTALAMSSLSLLSAAGRAAGRSTSDSSIGLHHYSKVESSYVKIYDSQHHPVSDQGFAQRRP